MRVGNATFPWAVPAGATVGLDGALGPIRLQALSRPAVARLAINRLAVYYWRGVARTVNPHSHAVKRAEILDAALHLVSLRGYEAMAIQELLDNLEISRGALYHYFPSKSALLEALVDRVLVEAERALAPVAMDQSLAGPEAVSRFFVALGRYKASQKPFIVAVLPVWYSDDNALVRDKVRLAFASRLAPMLASVVERGCQAGTMAVSSPYEAARIVLGLTQDLAELLGRRLLTGDAAPSLARAQMRQMVTATTEAVERVLGVPRGSIYLVEPDGLDAWIGSLEDDAS
jgi:AcrR family transcriptional regulator